MDHLDESSTGNEQTRNVSLKAPSSEPPLHPRRDSNEDANETVTRKRPRLEFLNEPRAITMSPASETTVCSSLHTFQYHREHRLMSLPHPQTIIESRVNNDFKLQDIYRNRGHMY